MSINKKNYASGDYTVSYRDMRGVDFSGSGSEISTSRFAYLENMYKDYDADGGAVTESVPGFRKILSLGKKINGIYSRTSKSTDVSIIVHAGDEIYSFPIEERDSLTKLTPIASAADRKSHAFNHGDMLYLFDGEGITIIGDSGVTKVQNGDESAVYVPTTFLNGVEYEQRNLLTRRFIEKNFITTCDNYGHGTPGLKYQIISEPERKAKVCASNIYVEDLSIPSFIILDGKKYNVTEIGDAAFRGNSFIRSVTISSGIEKIGRFAFGECNNLVTVITPDSLKEIGASAFYDCKELVNFHLGASFEEFGNACFEECDKLIDLHYALDTISFAEIINYDATAKITIFYNVDNLSATLEIPIHSRATSLTSVKIGGRNVDYETLKDSDGIITAIVIVTDNKYEIEGHEIEICGKLSESEYAKISQGCDIVTASGGSISSLDAICHCTLSEVFDGRIFLSGNSELPNTVFYTARDNSGNNTPLYIGALNYFNDGVGGFPVKSMLATANSLIVFKSGDDGSGSIFYHTPLDTESDILPKVYPIAYMHSGHFSKGESISFFDDPLFVSPLGVCALEKQNINLERNIACRSHNVNKKLLSERLEDVRLAEWCGYLVLLASGSIYLADSRSTFVHSTGSTEYEWYYLSGIGTYSDDTRVYRYVSVERDGFKISDKMGERTELTVYSEEINGEMVYFVEEGKTRYEVYPTEEFIGGVFSPATEIYGEGQTLIFGTESGDICIFNNDLRGVAPNRIRALTDYDENEYKKTMGRKIHPDFYSFANHAPRYALKSALDNCGIPHLTKNTIKHSLTLKCKTFTTSSIICEVGTDISGYREITSFPAGEFNFAEIDFSTLSANTSDSCTLPISEKEKGWVEKQITLYSDEFAAPFGIYSITYRFAVKGKIKKDSR